ncbi:MAG TPA: phosphoribosylformylglycinamidine synthase subunit PurL [Chloroflexota bacterium]|nr:phosphoribosylformylglycinamidine synthase subunit PurL [Chloroflexota bacterium]
MGLTPHEYEHICKTLDREPNPLELGMFGVLWSEHCSYKHSKQLLRRFPTRGARVIQGPGENAGAVDIGHGLAAVMKIESHNHPSAVEPFQGAATGVGGILRDIFTMGARPIALMDALCFGSPGHPRTAHLLNGVVEGIAFYGNCVGVPTVGGSIAFHSTYNDNPLVNVLCLGLVRKADLLTSCAQGVGNPVLLVGSDTGRDGIAGASFASAELGSDGEEQRPAVQVGNPFMEKLLIEACLELVGDEGIVAMQDLGAAGLTGAATEMVSRSSLGIDIDVARVSRRERGMSPAEVMLSESQERMLIVAREGAEERIRALFRRWGLNSDIIGTITDTGLVRVREGDTLLAELPAAFLSGGAPEPPAPVVEPRSGPLRRVRGEPRFADGEWGGRPVEASEALLRLLGSPQLGSRRSVFEQYDHMVQTNTVVAPGEGAAVLRIKGTPLGLALGLGDGGNVCAVAPRTGGAMAVAEACRNVSCAGAQPIAVTDCLNFGDPERAAVWHALDEVVAGMSEACIALDVPVISGNVSLYNESRGAAIRPTPIVGALGILDNVACHARAVARAGDELWLLGPTKGSLGSSQYAAIILESVGGEPPGIDLELERRVQACVREIIAAGRVSCATDVADGGLAVALAEIALASGVGVMCDFGAWSDPASNGLADIDELLFGEAPSRIIVSAARGAADAIRSRAASHGVPVTLLGRTGGEVIQIGALRVPLSDARARWEQALAHIGETAGGMDATS